MTDIVDKSTRSRMMSGIRNKNTKPELAVRQLLRAHGYGYRLGDKKPAGLPFRTDIVLTRHRTVILVHGCFWHRHRNCAYATTPATRIEKWKKKFAANEERDKRQEKELNALGWRVVVIWECGIRHNPEGTLQILPLLRGQAETIHWPTNPPRPNNSL